MWLSNFRPGMNRGPHGQGSSGSRGNQIEGIKKTAGSFLNWNPQERLQNAMKLGSYLSRNLKTSQIRKVLEIARRVHFDIQRGNERDFLNDIVRMRYLLAYAVGKATNRYQREALRDLYEVLDPMLERVMNDPKPENFEVFYDFLQAVVAYHKFYGGGD
ncbi:type III-A CRISPR-associated protein Csm2 [Thermococcus sp.]|uniref:type III-A CRISPR-associated protein Csm2 n=1 Tax=Thermococcus sp. TaxID=35749 RepID=UPI002620D26E|nr:type III-A CRISPR-associated protein Csm2 [Thermococcus sp.]